MRIANAVDATRPICCPAICYAGKAVSSLKKKRTASLSPFAVHVARQKAVAGAVRFSCEL